MADDLDKEKQAEFNKIERIKIVVLEFNPVVDRHLRKLVDCGLYGDNVEEVAKHIFLEALRNTINYSTQFL